MPGKPSRFSDRKNTNLAEDIEILLPVKVRWIPFSGFSIGPMVQWKMTVHRKSIMKLHFLSIPLFSLSGISSWVVYWRFVTDFDFFFFKRTLLLLIKHQFLQFWVVYWRFVTDFDFFFFKRTLLLLIKHHFLQFWYQCIKKTSVYGIIGNFSRGCRRNTRKTDKVYNFLQSAKLSCVDDLWTQTLRSISQSPRATSVRYHSLTSFDISMKVGFLF